MASLSYQSTPGILQPRIGPVHRLSLAFVWLTFAVSAIVFSEPAPVDLFMLGVIVMLPVIGLIRITPPLIVFLAIWLIAGACALIGTVNAIDPTKALIHTSVTFFLTLSSFVMAAFIMRRPEGHTHLIMHAYVIAAVLAALTALVGYFDLIPGTAALFTKYGRAAGTFKDPNVFGPFLVPPILYLLHCILTRSLGRALFLCACMGVLSLGVLLSFSRGAWINLAVAVVVFAYLAFVTAPTNRQRLKIIGGAFAAMVISLSVLVAATQIDSVSRQLQDRATMDQTYDQGPEGRFGGQEKARRLILENPLGIGAQQFAPQHHLEEPHNVYLAMFLNAGWLGGMIFALMVFMTCLFGLRHAFKRTLTQPLFLVAYACFVAHALEGFVIDLDHWRHFHLLMAVVWGLMLGDRQIINSVAKFDPRRIFEQPEMLVPSRPGRLLTPARAQYARRTTIARRAPGREDSRPGRAVGRTFARQVPET
jgi:O-antigen ligase